MKLFIFTISACVFVIGVFGLRPVNQVDSPELPFCKSNADCIEGSFCKDGDCIAQYPPLSGTELPFCKDNSECPEGSFCKDGDCYKKHGRKNPGDL